MPQMLSRSNRAITAHCLDPEFSSKAPTKDSPTTPVVKASKVLGSMPHSPIQTTFFKSIFNKENNKFDRAKGITGLKRTKNISCEILFFLSVIIWAALG